MAIKFFGHYLVDEKKLTNEQLIEVADYQSTRNLSLGEWAVDAGLITAKDAQKINDMQKTLDKRFGDVAIELGLLNESQIEMLLKKQKDTRVYFGEAVVLKGFMTQEELDNTLKEFENSQKEKTDDLNTQIDNLPNAEAIKDSIETFQTIYFRIIQNNIKLVDVYINESLNKEGIISTQNMRGDQHMDFALQCIGEVTADIASKYLKMPFEKDDEDLPDALNEFLNVILGNIAVKFSDKEDIVELTPPLCVDQNTFKYQEYVCFDFITSKGTITFCIKS